jgi:hypothetical protein
MTPDLLISWSCNRPRTFDRGIASAKVAAWVIGARLANPHPRHVVEAKPRAAAPIQNRPVGLCHLENFSVSVVVNSTVSGSSTGQERYLALTIRSIFDLLR